MKKCKSFLYMVPASLDPLDPPVLVRILTGPSLDLVWT